MKLRRHTEVFPHTNITPLLHENQNVSFLGVLPSVGSRAQGKTSQSISSASFNLTQAFCLFPSSVPASQAVVVDRTVYLSGQLGMDPASGQLVEGGVQAQTRQVSNH